MIKGMRVRDFSAENPPLSPGDEVHCPHCRDWHSVATLHAEGTAYTQQMLYWQCLGGNYYVGSIGTSSRHETRRAETGA
jgi:hypothetical protein